LSWWTYELLHELGVGHPGHFERVGGQKPILDIKEWRLARFGCTPCDQAQVGCFLSILGKQHAPAGIGDAHDIVVARVNV
jgi:hypothetical protein